MIMVEIKAHWPVVGVNVYKVVAKLFNAGDQIPEIPLFDIVGKAVKVAPEQIAAIGVNVGVTFGFTVMVMVAVEEHCPLVGANVYKVVAKLFKAGDQVPVIPLFEVVGKAAKVAPEQIAAIGVNVGFTFGFTVMVMVVVEEHCPLVGANVYRVLAKLFKAGDQIPEIPLFDIVGKAAKVAPEQIALTGVNVGFTFGFTVMVMVAVEEHCPVVGANVYKVVAKLFKAGDQVPVIPLFDVVGKAAKVAPAQIAAIGVNVGVTFGFTVMVIVEIEAH
jgi:hypothetical protein